MNDAVTRPGHRPNFLVTGATGQVGFEVVRAISPLGRVFAPSRIELDLGSPGSIREAVRAIRPSVIINAGAYTAVDRAEIERDACHAINAVAPSVLAEEAAASGSLLIHFSTDYVFDGSRGGPYVEDDQPHPVNWYGETKLAGEQAIQRVAGRFLILRTSWVFAARGANFFRTMLRLAHDRSEIRVVDDQSGCPTSARVLAATTAVLVQQIGGSQGAATKSGVYHVTSPDYTTWAGFAEAIMMRLVRRRAEDSPRIVGIASSEYPTAAKRPGFSVLSSENLGRTCGLWLPPWREQLELVAQEYEATSGRADSSAQRPARPA